MTAMPRAARIYVALIIACGGLGLATGILTWQCADPFRTALYVLITVLCSGLKVPLPAIKGTMSVSYVLFLLAFMQLSLGEALLMGLAATLVQSLWQAKERPMAVQVAFNIGSISIAIAGGYWIYHYDAWLDTGLRVQPAFRLAAAACVYFLLNTVSVALVISLTESRGVLRVWRECYFWSLPYYLLGASITGAMDYGGRHLGWEVSLLVLPVIYVIYNSYRLYLGRLENEKRHAQEMAALHLRTIEALALAIEAKDDNTHEHLRRVQVYATEIGKEMGLSDAELQAVQAAAILHDIGKLAVPDYIISKPGKLTPEEFEKMKIHPVVGAEILERVQFPYPVAPIVRSHHEKWNGSGYPDGLRGEEIPAGARILAVVDCLDALASDRQYRRALPLEEAMGAVVAGSGTSYDPRIVGILERRYQELEKIAQLRSAGEAPFKLSKDVRIGRGDAPGAGFEKSQGSSRQESGAPDFLLRIAAARQEVQALYELTHELGNSLSLHETLSVLCLRLKQLIPHDAIAIFVRAGERLKPCFVSGESARLFSGLEIPVGQGLSGWVAENGKAVINGNPAVEAGYLNDPTKFTSLRSALAVPLQSVNGFGGVLALYRLHKDAFSQDHLRILLAINPKLTMAIGNALKYEEAQENATTDGLTGLPNARSLFLRLDSELSRCRRSGETLAVVVCDLDGFKLVNDRYGHLHGNRVLKLLSQRIKEQCREYDYVARMGGDEFVLILPDFRKDSLEAKMETLARVVADAGLQVCEEPRLTLSAGYAVYPEDGPDAEQLLAAADYRMYSAKQSQRSGPALVPAGG